MHPRLWVYRRNLSNNPQSPFYSNNGVRQIVVCCVSGFLGLVFLGLAIVCFLTPKTPRDSKHFLIYLGLFGACEVICILICCIPRLCRKFTRLNSEERGDSSSSLLSSKEQVHLGVPDRQGIASYQACAISSEVPTYQEVVPNIPEAPSYQAAGLNAPLIPYCGDGAYLPCLGCTRSLVNYEGVFGYQQIPIYQQDMIEPQLPHYSTGYVPQLPSPQKDIHVY